MMRLIPVVNSRLSLPRYGVCLVVCLCAHLLAAKAPADVVVIANRTRQQVACRVVPQGGAAHPIELAAGGLVVVPLQGPCELLYEMSDNLVRYRLDANAAYFFSQNDNGWLDVGQIDLGGNEEMIGNRPVGDKPLTNAVGAIPVKLLVDNHELTTRQVWEARLRKRVTLVSDILEQYCQLRLEIVAVEEWDAGDEVMDFKQSLQMFQQQVDPRPARLAIGFTGRYRQQAGRMHLGSTPGLLQSHILVREWSATMSEPERTEVLLHEVGHFLGAVHSPDPVSVMRPMLADDKAIHRQFRIGFDPVNTLIVNMISEEMRGRKAYSIGELSPGTRLRLSQIYGKLAQQFPNDNAASQFQFQLGLAGDTPLANGTRRIVRAVRQAAEDRRDSADQQPLLDGDQLTEYYVRRAAEVAATLPDSIAPSAMLLGLGISLDDSGTLLRTAMTREFCETVETPSERRDRYRLLGNPTLHGRRDLAQHFFLSAYLTTIVGAPAAESAGVVKEMADAKSGSGFSYVDLAADLAGIAFAQRLLQGQLTLQETADRFGVAGHMPHIEELPEGLRWEDVEPQLVGTDEHSFRGYRQEIHRRIQRLSAPAGTSPDRTP